jgi:hypothetical protein
MKQRRLHLRGTAGVRILCRSLGEAVVLDWGKQDVLASLLPVRVTIKVGRTVRPRHGSCLLHRSLATPLEARISTVHSAAGIRDMAAKSSGCVCLAAQSRPRSHSHGVVCGSLGDATWHRDRVLPCRIRSQQSASHVSRRACGSSETERVEPTDTRGSGGTVVGHHDDEPVRQHERNLAPNHVHCHTQ